MFSVPDSWDRTMGSFLRSTNMSDYTEVPFRQYWASGQPDDLWFDQDCAHIDYDSETGQWDDEDCDEEKHFVCKVASVA